MTDGHKPQPAPDPGARARKELEEALEENRRLQEALGYAREAAHELAQPLTTILARSQLLLTRCAPDSPQRPALEIISREAGRLADIIERFQRLKEMAGPSRPERS